MAGLSPWWFDQLAPDGMILAPVAHGGVHPIVTVTNQQGAGRPVWGDYLQEFHAARPGITERVLRQARDQGRDPYEWLIDRLPVEGGLLDLAGGNGALAIRLLPALTVILLDISAAELAAARERGVRRLVRADTAELPVQDCSVDAVACSMALMLVPLWPTLTEIRRVLKPGGRFVATLPAAGPLTIGDGLRYTRLLLALRRVRITYPNNRRLARPAGIFAAAGLELISDQRRRFGYRVETADAADLLVRSLYLPGSRPDRLAAARRVAGGWAGRELGIPIRRLVAVRTQACGPAGRAVRPP